MKIFEEDVIKILNDLGLTNYEARVYLTLISLGAMTATQLSFQAKIPRPKVYGAIRKLVEKGLVFILPEKPEKYTGASPSIFYSILEDRARQIRTTNTIIKILEKKYKEMKRSEYESEREILVIKGRENIYQKIKEAANRMRKEALLLTTANGLIRTYRGFKDLIAKKKGKGINLKIITCINQFNYEFVEKLISLSPKEIQIRHMNELTKMRILIIDNKEMILFEAVPDNISTSSMADIGIWTNSKSFLSLMKYCFYAYWERASDALEVIKKIEKNQRGGRAVARLL